MKFQEKPTNISINIDEIKDDITNKIINVNKKERKKDVSSSL
jgi:hypothetical protein